MGSMWAEPATGTAGPPAVTSPHTSHPLFPSHMSPFDHQSLHGSLSHPSHTGAHCPIPLGTPGHPAHAVGTGQSQAGAAGVPRSLHSFPVTSSNENCILELCLTLVRAPLMPAGSGEQAGLFTEAHNSNTKYELHKLYFLSTGRTQGEQSSANHLPRVGRGAAPASVAPRDEDSSSSSSWTLPSPTLGGSRGDAVLQPVCREKKAIKAMKAAWTGLYFPARGAVPGNRGDLVYLGGNMGSFVFSFELFRDLCLFVGRKRWVMAQVPCV